MAISNDQLNTIQTAIFQLIKESGPESLALIVRYLGSQDLAMSIVTNSRDDKKRFSDFSTIPDFKVAYIDKKLRNQALDRFLEELGYFSTNSLAILDTVEADRRSIPR